MLQKNRILTLLYSIAFPFMHITNWYLFHSVANCISVSLVFLFLFGEIAQWDTNQRGCLMLRFTSNFKLMNDGRIQMKKTVWAYSSLDLLGYSGWWSLTIRAEETSKIQMYVTQQNKLSASPSSHFRELWCSYNILWEVTSLWLCLRKSYIRTIPETVSQLITLFSKEMINLSPYI